MTSLNDALQTALRGGAVSGLFTVAMSLLGVGGLFAALTSFAPAGMDAGEWAQHIPFLIVGYGFGASFVALFAQLGGGIYTKAADVGADLVGKVEAGIPEDDPRNPAVIADLVGDNVGDCAGRGADLFESTAAENIGAMILGVLLYQSFGINGILFPLVIMALGLICSIVGVMVVRTKEDADPMKALNRGYYVTAALVTVAFFFATRMLLNPADAPNVWWHFFLCGLIGIATSIAFVFITQYYTEYRYRPVLGIAEASQTGPATNIIAGIAVGMESTVLPVITIGIAIISSYTLGQTSGLVNAAGESDRRLVRHRGRDDGHARHGRLHPGDGRLRADHGQRGRHRRDVAPAGVGARQDRPPRLGGQHDQGADEGLCHRLRGARGVPAVLGVPRRGAQLHRADAATSISRSRWCSWRACSARCSSSGSRRSR